MLTPHHGQLYDDAIVRHVKYLPSNQTYLVVYFLEWFASSTPKTISVRDLRMIFKIQEIDVKAGGGKSMTMGEFIKAMITRLEWFETRWVE